MSEQAGGGEAAPPLSCPPPAVGSVCTRARGWVSRVAAPCQQAMLTSAAAGPVVGVWGGVVRRRYREAGQLCVEEAYKCQELAARVQLLQDAANIFKAGVKAGVKELAFHENATNDQIKLLKLQHALEEENPDVRPVERGAVPVPASVCVACVCE